MIFNIEQTSGIILNDICEKLIPEDIFGPFFICCGYSFESLIDLSVTVTINLNIYMYYVCATIKVNLSLINYHQLSNLSTPPLNQTDDP